MSCLLCIDSFPPKSPTKSVCFVERDLQIKASYASSPPCMKIRTVKWEYLQWYVDSTRLDFQSCRIRTVWTPLYSTRTVWTPLSNLYRGMSIHITQTLEYYEDPYTHMWTPLSNLYRGMTVHIAQTLEYYEDPYTHMWTPLSNLYGGMTVHIAQTLEYYEDPYTHMWIPLAWTVWDLQSSMKFVGWFEDTHRSNTRVLWEYVCWITLWVPLALKVGDE